MKGSASTKIIPQRTPTSKRVDFHSFRRAFATSLAEAEINEQRAIRLTALAESKVHAKYVQDTHAVVIPKPRVPALPALPFPGLDTVVSERS